MRAHPILFFISTIAALLRLATARRNGPRPLELKTLTETTTSTTLADADALTVIFTATRPSGDKWERRP
jgi:hypothetical protein